MSEEEVLDWLRKNRFRQPELNLFMYALIAIAIGFVLYTAFLLQCFKPPAPPKIQTDKKEKWEPACLPVLLPFVCEKSLN